MLLQKRSKSIDFYNSPASGIRNYREASKDIAKKNDRNVCASLRKRMEDSVRDTEKLVTELKQRRERQIDANNISSITGV